MSANGQQQKVVEAPPKFKDASGRVWALRLTGGLIDDVRDATGVDLIPENKDVSAITSLLLNHRKLEDVLWALCRKVAESGGVDRRGFADGFDGDAYLAGWKAIVDAILFFIQSQSVGLARAVQELVEAQMRLIEAGAMEVLTALESSEVDEALRETAKKIGVEMRAGVVKELANSVSN